MIAKLRPTAGSSNGSGRLQEYFSDECVLHLRPTGNGAAELSHGEEKQAGKSHVATYVDAVASSARGKRLLHGTFGAEKRSGDPPPEETGQQVALWRRRSPLTRLD